MELSISSKASPGEASPSEAILSDAITGAEVDENIAMALRAVVFGNHREPFAEELAQWVRDGLVTTEGVVLTREEFRRRLEAQKMRYAGRAEQMKISEAADELEVKVLNQF